MDFGDGPNAPPPGGGREGGREGVGVTLECLRFRGGISFEANISNQRKRFPFERASLSAGAIESRAVKFWINGSFATNSKLPKQR